MERIRLDKTLSKAVDDYLEYRRTVGEDDGGRLFSPEEYEDYKRAVFPQRLQNRLYVSFGVPGGIDCKLIGPETPCFCTHRFKQHQTDFEVVPPERPIVLPCRVQGCRCSAYQFIHLNGSQPVRCRCKHFAHDHSETTEHVCRKCTSCSGFWSPYTCGCGQPSSDHQMLVETRTEREARGRPVGRDVSYAAMGGLTGFSSLADGYLRLDDSGAGASPLCVPLSHRGEVFQEHVFEKAYGVAPSSGFTEGSSVMSVTRAVSDLRTREEEDMAYFERRYQERIKAENMAVKQTSSFSRGRQSTKPVCRTSTKPTTSLSKRHPTKQPSKVEKRTNS